MDSKNATADFETLGKQLLEMERATVAAFKRKDDKEFTKHFARNYIGVANDGVKGSAEEIAGMHKLDLREISISDEKILFPAKNIAILTYTMSVDGTLGDKTVSGSIYSSTVYIKENEEWQANLHTESMAPEKS
jgi:Domain of unknown function (DUF4440)